ncbi:MAG: hypothetical protein ACKO1M_12235 [Planctomycetota bacterium]
MSVSRLRSRRGWSPAAIVLLLVTAIVGGSLEIRPAPAGGCSIAAADHAPDPQAREESPEESEHDEEGESAKHVAIGSTLTIEPPRSRCGQLFDRHGRLAGVAHLGAAPIRGPPSRA